MARVVCMGRNRVVQGGMVQCGTGQGKGCGFLAWAIIGRVDNS